MSRNNLVKRERLSRRLSLLWEHRRFLFRCAAMGFARFDNHRLPDSGSLHLDDAADASRSSRAGNGVDAGSFGQKAGDLGGIGAELLGLKTTGDLFVGVLHSRTVADDLINKFDLAKGVWHPALRRCAERFEALEGRWTHSRRFPPTARAGSSRSR